MGGVVLMICGAGERGIPQCLYGENPEWILSAAASPLRRAPSQRPRRVFILGRSHGGVIKTAEEIAYEERGLGILCVTAHPPPLIHDYKHTLHPSFTLSLSHTHTHTP